MSHFDSADGDALLSGRSGWIDREAAAELAAHPLDSVGTEFPHHVGSVDSPDDFEHPSDQHPVFYGSFDWHSAVHSHWSLVRLCRLFDDHPDGADVVESLDARITDENVAGEVEYFEENESFEKPYGWGWLLRLAAELHLWAEAGGDRAADWRATLAPLEDRILDLVETDLLTHPRPFRVGTHGNSAFALSCVLDYARVTGNRDLESATAETARRFYGDDADYPVEYEPLGWDFLSPALVEADLLRRVLDPPAFRDWLDQVLPDVTAPPCDSVLDPVDVDPGSDGGIELHLVGLNLSKAWCLAGVADGLGEHPYADPFEESAVRHARRGLDRAFTDDYAGAHWLSSFVLYLLTREEGGIAP